MGVPYLPTTYITHTLSLLETTILNSQASDSGLFVSIHKVQRKRKQQFIAIPPLVTWMQKWHSLGRVSRDLQIHHRGWQRHLAPSLAEPRSSYHLYSATPAQQAALWKGEDNALVAHLLGIDGVHLNSFANGWLAKSFILKGLCLMLIIHSLPVNMFILLGNTLIYAGTWNIATNVTRLEMNKQDLVWIAKWHSKMRDARYKMLPSN